MRGLQEEVTGSSSENFAIAGEGGFTKGGFLQKTESLILAQDER